MTSLISISGERERSGRISKAAPIQPPASGERTMIIVVSPDATPDDIGNIISRIEETGRQAHLSTGTERSIIGVIGPDAPELQDMFETTPHVESAARVTKPYKLVSRDFHPLTTVIQVTHGVSAGVPGC